MSNLQEFYDIQIVQSPWRPVNFGFIVYDQFGRVDREMYGTIQPKDATQLGMYGVPAVKEAFIRWLYADGLVSKEKHETVTVEVYPWAGLRVSNLDLFLRRSIGALNVAMGSTLHASKGLSTLRVTTPYSVARMAAELDRLRRLYEKGRAPGDRQRFIEKWASSFETDPRDGLTLSQGLEAAANFFDVPYEKIPISDGDVLHTVNNSMEDYFPMLRIRVSGGDGYHYCYKINRDHSEQTEVFGKNEVRAAIDWVRDHLHDQPEYTQTQARTIRNGAPSYEMFEDLCAELHEAVPAHYGTYMQGAQEFIIRRPKTLSGPQVLGTLTYCLDREENPYFTWTVECSENPFLTPGVEWAEKTTHHIELRSRQDKKEFAVKILESLKVI